MFDKMFSTALGNNHLQNLQPQNPVFDIKAKF